MKLSLLILGLIFSLNTYAQQADPVGDLIDRVNKEDAAAAAAKKRAALAKAAAAKVAAAKAAAAKKAADDAAVEKVMSDFDKVVADRATKKAAAQEAAEAASEKAARQKMLFSEAYAANSASQAVQLAGEAQSRLQPQSQKPCPIPPYTSMPYNEAEQDFFDQGFVGPKNGDHPTMPQVSMVDLSKAAPNATHVMNLTVAIEAGSGWTVKEVDDTLARQAAVYAQCGIRVRRATVVYSHFPTGMPVESSMPSGQSKPWLFFVGKRTENTPNTSGADLRESTWIGRDSISKNGTLMNQAITPAECEQLRSNSKLLRKL